MEYKDHPLTTGLPLLGQVELAELAADIQGNGLKFPIVLLDGMILDGRNRYRACRMIGVTPDFRDFNGHDGDPVDFILSVNVKRLHLTASQKGMVVAKILSLPRGNPNLKSSKTPIKPKSVQNTELGKTASEVAEKVGVSTSTIEQSKRVLEQGSKELISEVESGTKSASAAVKEIRQAKPKVETQFFDKTGFLVPATIVEDWTRAAALRSLLNQVSEVRATVKAGLDEKDAVFAEINNTTVADLNNAYSSLKNLIPYAVCTSCQGKQKTKCGLCKGRGFISEFAYKHFVPAETRAIREKMRAAK